MKRVLCTSTAVLALAGLAASSAVAAGHGGKGSQTLSATCTVNGAVTVHASSGQSAWVNNTHWVVLRFTGTFTPAGGTAQTFTKVYGKKKGLLRRTIDTCSGTQTDSSGNTFSFTATVAKTTRT
jgi:hypothetical protein